MPWPPLPRTPDEQFESYVHILRSESALAYFNEPMPTTLVSVQRRGGWVYYAAGTDPYESVESDPVDVHLFRTRHGLQVAAWAALEQLYTRWNELHPRALPIFRFGPLRMGQPDAVEGME